MVHSEGHFRPKPVTKRRASTTTKQEYKECIVLKRSRQNPFINNLAGTKTLSSNLFYNIYIGIRKQLYSQE